MRSVAAQGRHGGRAAAIWPRILAASAGFGLAATVLPAHAVTIVPTFDSSISSSANASTIETDIDNALTFYGNFSNTDQVDIDFQLAPSGASYLGGSQSTFYLAPYAEYTSAMLANATATGNPTALIPYQHLSTGNKADLILETSADFRALGFSGAPGLYSANGAFDVGGSFDGIVYLNGADLLGFGGGGDYNPTRVIQHEVDEVLGIGGSGSVLNIVQQDHLSTPPVYEDAGDPDDPLNGDTYIGALDMFRYSSAGHASLTTSGSASSYFSINGGVTDIAPFNQNSSGDYADWGGSGCIALVQQAFSCSGQSASLTLTSSSPTRNAPDLLLDSPEVIALRTVGYDLPEPASIAMLGVSVLGLGWARRRRKG
ncbi:MAG TPA: PEP-CTERM sorting domain-containing protein [Acetobacteraceae bacterium]|jgi:hypothetical protein